jgi:glyoxylase-like metal-dependent hydrolase (beta-lactamase superfamily II)
VCFDEKSFDAVIIDPVLNFDQASGQIKDKSLKELQKFIAEKKLKIKGILETHAHADHLTSSYFLKKLFPEAILAIGEKIKIVQEVFKSHFHLNYIHTDGRQFDKLFKDFEEFSFGTLKMKAIPTPGHTPACMSYLFGDALFSGDALFMPDSGTGRCDFPKGSAKDLYLSIAKNIYQLPNHTKIFVGHDYAPNSREIKFETSVGESKISNIQIKESTSEKEYISFREARDKTLSAPKLLLPSIQINIDAGKLPPAESNGVSYLKLPLEIKF